MLKHKGTYEIISPEDIGLERTNEAGIVLGKLRYVIFFSLEHISDWILSTLLIPIFFSSSVGFISS